MTDTPPAGERFALPGLVLIIEGEGARAEVVRWTEELGEDRFHQLTQAALLNCPDNIWRVNHVNVLGLDLTVTADYSGLHDWVTVAITDQRELSLTFVVLPSGEADERPVFTLRRIIDS